MLKNQYPLTKDSIYLQVFSLSVYPFITTEPFAYLSMFSLILFFFFIFQGQESLIAIEPKLMNTTEDAMQYFQPSKRKCYGKDEFILRHFNTDYGWRYSMYNCMYESLLQSALKNCSCIPYFAKEKFPARNNYTHFGVCEGISLSCYQKLRGM